MGAKHGQTWPNIRSTKFIATFLRNGLDAGLGARMFLRRHKNAIYRTVDTGLRLVR